MPNINDMKHSKYLTKHDVEPDVLVTITACEEKDVSMESQPPEMKWVLSFEETDKPMVLNWTNINLIAVITGEEHTEDWVGHKIVLWNDRTIMFAGKITGGIRVRKPKNTIQKAADEAQAAHDDKGPPPTDDEAVDEDLPF